MPERTAKTLQVGITRKFQFTDPTSGKLTEAWAKSWPKHPVPAKLERMSLFSALTSTFAYPAFLVQHAPTPHRLGREVFTTPGALEKIGQAVMMEIAAFDADAPGHGKRIEEQATPIEEWWEQETIKIERLLLDIPNLYVYRSLGGYRIVGILPKPVGISSAAGCALWTREYQAWANFLHRAYRIEVDSLSDWNRLQRVPHDSRDYQTITHLECLGDPANVGLWEPELHQSDYPPIAAPKESRQTTEGDPILLELVRARGLRCDDMGNGEFDICCPRADSHSPMAGMKDYPRKTILYAHQGALGRIWCQSDGCKLAHTTPQSWLTEFSKEEIKAAEKSLGKEEWKPTPLPPDEPPSVERARHELFSKCLEEKLTSIMLNPMAYEAWAKEKHPELAVLLWTTALPKNNPHAEPATAQASSTEATAPTNDDQEQDPLDGPWDTEWKFDEGVEWVSRRYFSVADGAKISFYDESDGTPHKLGGKEEFMYELAAKKILTIEQEKGKPPKKKLIPIAPIWIASEGRRYYKRGFSLESNLAKASKETYNLWKGFSCEPVPGDWSRMKDHIFNILAKDDADLGDYILKWSAWAIQHPEQVAKVALVFRGGEGIGKGIFCDALVNIFGQRHGMRVQNMVHLVGKFNSHLRSLCMLFVDEAIAVDKGSEGALKGLISEQTLPIEGKGKDVVVAPNHLHVLLASNEDWVVPAGKESRRYVVVDVPDDKKGNADYFNAIAEQLYADGKRKPGAGLAAMLHDLQTMNIKGWHPEKNRVETQALEAQRARSLPPHERYWQSFLETGSLHPSCCIKVREDGGMLELRVTAHKVLDYLTKVTNTTATVVDITNMLTRSGATRIKSSGRMTWKLPTLLEAQKAWNARYVWPVLAAEDQNWTIAETPTAEEREDEDSHYQPPLGAHGNYNEAPNF